MLAIPLQHGLGLPSAISMLPKIIGDRRDTVGPTRSRQWRIAQKAYLLLLRQESWAVVPVRTYLVRD